MKISEIQKIENFQRNFKETVEPFLLNQYGENFTITWFSPSLFKRVRNEPEIWVCNSNINSIYQAELDTMSANVVIGEYSATIGRPLRSILQWIYVRLCFKKPFSQYFADQFLQIIPDIPNSKSLLFMGGLRKIRIVNSHEKNVFLISKINYDNRSIENEYIASSNHATLKSPRLLDCNLEDGWIKQEYFPGVPANRLEQERRTFVYNSAMKILNVFARESLKNINIHYHVTTKIQKIAANLEHIAQNKKCEEIIRIQKSLAHISRYFKYENIDILLSDCHGDFHEGNVLATKTDFRIIDWEAMSKRSYGYDVFTYMLRSRSVIGYSARLKNIGQKIENSDVPIFLHDWFEGLEKRKLYFKLFLLEEIDFYLSEIAEAYNEGNLNAYMQRHNAIMSFFDGKLNG